MLLVLSMDILIPSYQGSPQLKWCLLLLLLLVLQMDNHTLLASLFCHYFLSFVENFLLLTYYFPPKTTKFLRNKFFLFHHFPFELIRHHLRRFLKIGLPNTPYLFEFLIAHLT